MDMLENLNSAYLGERVISKRPRHNIQIVNNVNPRQGSNVKVHSTPMDALTATNIQKLHVMPRVS
jgi:hypothetical protein